MIQWRTRGERHVDPVVVSLTPVARREASECVRIDDARRRVDLADYIEAREINMTSDEAALAASSLTMAEMAWIELEMRERRRALQACEYDPFREAI